MSDIYRPLSELKKEREAALGASPAIPQPTPLPESGVVTRTPTTPVQQQTRPPVKRYGLQFTGTAGEYFRIWIVNMQGARREALRTRRLYDKIMGIE